VYIGVNPWAIMYTYLQSADCRPMSVLIDKDAGEKRLHRYIVRRTDNAVRRICWLDVFIADHSRLCAVNL